jgi:endonuclease/exonuclease/phosphatase (EEP) superfamily protein YafD
MKVISLNTWGAKGGTQQLLDFFEKYRDTDVFCLQEVFDGGEEFRGLPTARFTLETFEPELLRRISERLPEHVPYFRPHFAGIFGLVTFVRKELDVMGEGKIDIYREDGYYSRENIAEQNRILQYVALEEPSCVVSHVHGLWNGKGKLDTEDRLAQSDKIVAFLTALDKPCVLLGDFNLRPDTKSIRKLEEAGLRNLISEYGIATTRTSLYDNRAAEPHADYAFVSEGVKVRDFRILHDEVSDHAPLYIEFDV